MENPFDPSTLRLGETLLLLGVDAIWPYWLTVVRFYGLLTTAPVFGDASIPQRLRIAIAVVFGIVSGSIVATPAASDLGAWPDPLWLSGGEFIVGAALGLGVKLVLGGLQVAASLLEQQWGLASPSNPGPEGSGGPAIGQLFTILGTLLFLTAAPVGGDLFLMRSLLESLRSLPPGAVVDVAGPTAFVQDVVLTSLLLGLQVAAPVMVSVGLGQIVWAMLARRRGGAVWQAPLAPARLLLGLLVLAVSLSGIGERIGDALSGVTAAGVSQVSQSSTTGSAEQ